MPASMTSSKTHHHARGRTGQVILITALTMVAEIVAGLMTGSMALLADGWHMATHVGALAVTWASYYLADHPRFRDRFTFGGGKILVLGAYTSAIMLLLTAGWMIFESVERFFIPVPIHPKEAMVVTVIGLLVNLASMALLGGHGHSHGHDHDHAHGHEDLNLASAYAHVLADALTSVLALVALALALFWNLNWADPLVGILGAVMIVKWAVGLIKQSAHQLLDGHATAVPPTEVEAFLAEQGLRSSCLHLWQLDGQKTAMHVRATTRGGRLPPLEAVRRSLLTKFPIDHLVVELTEGPVDCDLHEQGPPSDQDHDHGPGCNHHHGGHGGHRN